MPPQHRTIWNPADVGVIGRWGESTASIDWCESNFKYSPYVAEMVNTLTNVAFMGLAAFGLKKDVEHRLGLRFVAAHTGLLLIGVGSALFHMTLQYSWQLCDELPMIYVSTLFTWILFDLTPVGAPQSTSSVSIPLGLLAFNVLFTWAYLEYPNAVFHQLAFGSLIAATTFRGAWLLVYKLQDTPANRARNAEARKLQFLGSASFLLAFISWNLDNLLCVGNQKLKATIGAPFSFLIEGHGWWHLFTGLGVYTIIASMCFLTLCIRDDPANYEINYVYGFLPWVGRTERGFLVINKGQMDEMARLID